MPAPRPLVAVALALALGALAGRALGAGAAALAGLALAALELAPRARGLRARAGAPRAAWLLLALSGLRADLARAAEPPAAPGAQAVLPDEPLVGRWRARGRLGWIQPACGAAPGVLLDVARAPPEGAWVALLPGAAAAPFASGPEPGPLSAEGRFRAEARVPPDLLVQLAPPAPREGLARALAARAGPAVDAARARLARRLARYEARAGLDRGAGRGLAGAMLLGLRDGLDREVQDLFTRTGMRHMLVVSGMNVGLLFGLCAGLAARLPARARRGGPWPRALAGCALVALYTPLAGADAPVTRAALMLGFALVAPTGLGGGRRPDAWSLCAAAYAVEALLHADAPARPAVQLSYLATLGLLCAPRPRASAPAGLGARGAAAVLAARAWTALRRGALMSVAATLATLPSIAATFGEAAPLGVVATPLCVPLLGAFLAALVAGLAAPELVPGGAAALPAELMIALLAAADRLPGTPVPLPPRPFLLLALACGGCLAALRSGRRARLALCAAAAALLPWSAHPAALEVVLLDVGHGTALVARGPGLPALVADAGSRDRPRVAAEALGPLLARWDPGRVWIVLSHDHRDHSAALDWLVERHPPEVYGGALPARLRERLPHAALVLDPGAGSVRLDPARDLRVLLARGRAEEGNEGSRAVLLEAPGARVALLGDAEGPGLLALLQGLPQGPVNLLVLPHHGSDTPYLGALLGHLPPGLSWVSAGAEPALARELDRRGLAWRRTGAPGPAGARSLRFRAPVGGAFPSSGQAAARQAPAPREGGGPARDDPPRPLPPDRPR